MKHLILLGFLGLFVSPLFFSCKHDPIIEGISQDSQDTIPNSGEDCDPNVVYYFKDIQPILSSNCAVSGCHDNLTHKERIDYSSYAKTTATGKVTPNNPNNSKMYNVLFESGEDKMPPAPRPELTPEQKALIKKWIAQGAENYFCDDNTNCDTTNTSYTNNVVPILTNNCIGCHNASNSSGGVVLDNYTPVASSALSGKLFGSINHDAGYVPMPPSGNLSNCDKALIKSWIDKGAPNN